MFSFYVSELHKGIHIFVRESFALGLVAENFGLGLGIPMVGGPRGRVTVLPQPGQMFGLGPATNVLHEGILRGLFVVASAERGRNRLEWLLAHSFHCKVFTVNKGSKSFGPAFCLLTQRLIAFRQSNV
jgi:hypothetical protein